MSHPTQEQLIEFLCAEAAPERAAEVARHLESCPACRAQVHSWRATQRRLAAWDLRERSRAKPARAGAARGWVPTRWAAAAAFLLLAGYGAARLTAPVPRLDSAALRAQVAKELREELRNELQQFSAAQARRQEQYQQALTRTIGELEGRRLADYAGLRRDVETVAVRAEDELLNTREGLARLAAGTSLRPAE